MNLFYHFCQFCFETIKCYTFIDTTFAPLKRILFMDFLNLMLLTQIFMFILE